MQEDPSISQIIQLELFGSVLTLHSACLDLVKFNGRFGQMNTSNTRPKSTKYNPLDKVWIVAISIECWRAGARSQRNKSKVAERV